MLRTVIIDDEPHMRQSLERIVKDHCPNARLVGSAGSVGEGVKTIRKYHPDLVLLDIKLDDGTGFDILSQLEPVDFKVIFITAFDQFAIKAFKFSALDYLLKPFDPADLTEAVNRAEKLVIQEMNMQLKSLQDNLQNGGNSVKKIVLKTIDKIYLIKVSDIVYCQSDGNYTRFNLVDNQSILVSNTLKDYDEMLREFGFFRVHQSYLINLSFINRFEKTEGGSVILNNDHRVPVASRKREQLMDLFERIGNH